MIFHRDAPYFLIIRQGTDTRKKRSNLIGVQEGSYIARQRGKYLTVVLCHYTISGIPRCIVYGG